MLAYIDESKAGEIAVGQVAEIVLRSEPEQADSGRVARIQPESDRVNEERRIEVAFNAIPENFNLGEQAEVYITTVHLAQALLVPEAAIEELGKTDGNGVDGGGRATATAPSDARPSSARRTLRDHRRPAGQGCGRHAAGRRAARRPRRRLSRQVQSR